jgi:hypothetical protein
MTTLQNIRRYQTGGLALATGQTYEDPEVAVEEEVVASPSPRAAARLTAMLERLRNERAGPSESDKWWAISSALARPTTSGGRFGQTLSNIGEAMTGYSTERRKAEQEKSAMISKYELGLAELEDRAESAKAQAAAKAAAALAKYGEVVKGTYTTTKNDLNQTIASYLTNSGHFVTQNLDVPSEFKVVKAPDIPNSGASPSPPTPPGGAPPSAEALAPKPAAGAAPLFLGNDGKRHAVGAPPYEGADGYMYRMGEGGQETVVSRAQSEAFKAREARAAEASKAREARTAADIAADASTEKPTAPERKDYYDNKNALRGFDQGLASMDRALAANGLAFEGTLASLASGAARLTGRNKEELAATALVRTALGEASLSSLKAMFPGSITEGEREALDGLYARGRTATRDERIAIIGEIKQWIRDKQAASLGLVQSYQQQYPSYFKIDPAAKTPVEEARAAIAKGANRDAVIKRLKENGIAPPGDL